VLQLPGVASKSFLITIADRSITGMVVQDQMVGPWQIPVSDVAVTSTNLQGTTGEAMAIGEKAPLALINHAASARMAVAESITNIAAAKIENLTDIVLSANWMSPAGHTGEDAGLYEAVQAIGMEFCPKLGLTIPVGKDSMSMKTVWEDLDHHEVKQDKSVTAPLSLVISAFARVSDVCQTITPQLQTDSGETELLYIDLGSGKNRLGGSSFAQVYGEVGHEAPDIEAQQLKNYFNVIQKLHNKILAYHDVSDGGLMTSLLEMSFAGHCGIDIQCDSFCADATTLNTALFHEELGCVIQIKSEDKNEIIQSLTEYGFIKNVHVIGTISDNQLVSVYHNSELLYQKPRHQLQEKWALTSYHVQKLRDNPECAEQEFSSISLQDNPGIKTELSFDQEDHQNNIKNDFVFNINKIKPKMAILREQGVNGQIEMAAAFAHAGFDAIDVHMSDIIEGRVSLSEFRGLVACGGFSYGDVLGAGEGWAKSILFNSRARDEFSGFYARDDSFGLGVCNGCQMMSNLHELIDGTSHWPHFERNLSDQFEARIARVEILDSPSIFFTGMSGSKLPIAVAHGEGRAVFHGQQLQQAKEKGLLSLQYVDNLGDNTENYPYNPNGSVEGITSLCSEDGRFTIMMPHPERVYRDLQNTWQVQKKDTDSAWMSMFYNARKWVD
ncbi:MAG: phosphoribosylformylglycinamidine synthase, partial [Gammaproteobacteria bacterium]|nr:phosphoribosylformylglycinamidine synthase [Gammaproteobacteria bacterium]